MAISLRLGGALGMSQNPLFSPTQLFVFIVAGVCHGELDVDPRLEDRV